MYIEPICTVDFQARKMSLTQALPVHRDFSKNNCQMARELPAYPLNFDFSDSVFFASFAASNITHRSSNRQAHPIASADCRQRQNTVGKCIIQFVPVFFDFFHGYYWFCLFFFKICLSAHFCIVK